MAKITVTVEGNDFNDIIQALSGLNSIYTREYSSPESLGDSESQESGTPWEVDSFEWFWSELTVGAQQIYKLVALHSGGCPREDIMEDLGASAHGIGGRLSSQGHAMNKFEKRFGHRMPEPMTYDYDYNKYYLRPDVVQLMEILELV